MWKENDAKEFRESRRIGFRTHVIIKNDIFLITLELKKNIMSSLHDILRNGDLERLKHLCEAGADIRSDNNYAIRLASRYGHLEVVKYLCEAGADIHSDNDYAVRLAS